MASSLEDVPWASCVHARCLGWGHGAPSTAPSRAVSKEEKVNYARDSSGSIKFLS